MVSRYLGIQKQLWTVAVVGGVSLSDHRRMSVCWSSSSHESLTGRGGLWAGVPCHVRGGVAIAAHSEAVWWSSAIRECGELWIVYSEHVHTQLGTIWRYREAGMGIIRRRCCDLNIRWAGDITMIPSTKHRALVTDTIRSEDILEREVLSQRLK